jgi:hypothetical protein
MCLPEARRGNSLRKMVGRAFAGEGIGSERRECQGVGSAFIHGGLQAIEGRHTERAQLHVEMGRTSRAPIEAPRW